MKTLKLVSAITLSLFLISGTSCAVKKDNGKHKGWFKFKSKGNSGNAKSGHPGKGHGNGNGNGAKKAKKS